MEYNRFSSSLRPLLPQFPSSSSSRVSDNPNFYHHHHLPPPPSSSSLPPPPPGPPPPGNQPRFPISIDLEPPPRLHLSPNLDHRLPPPPPLPPISRVSDQHQPYIPSYYVHENRHPDVVVWDHHNQQLPPPPPLPPPQPQPQPLQPPPSFLSAPAAADDRPHLPIGGDWVRRDARPFDHISGSYFTGEGNRRLGQEEDPGKDRFCLDEYLRDNGYETTMNQNQDSSGSYLDDNPHHHLVGYQSRFGKDLDNNVRFPIGEYPSPRDNGYERNQDQASGNHIYHPAKEQSNYVEDPEIGWSSAVDYRRENIYGRDSVDSGSYLHHHQHHHNSVALPSSDNLPSTSGRPGSPYDLYRDHRDPPMWCISAEQKPLEDGYRRLDPSSLRHPPAHQHSQLRLDNEEMDFDHPARNNGHRGSTGGKRFPNHSKSGHKNNVGREGSQELLRTPKKKAQRTSALLRVQLENPTNRNLRDESILEESMSGPSNGRDGSESVELDVTFKSNSLVAKAKGSPPSSMVGSDTGRILNLKKRSTRVPVSSSPASRINESLVGTLSGDSFTHKVDAGSELVNGSPRSKLSSLILVNGLIPDSKDDAVTDATEVVKTVGGNGSSHSVNDALSSRTSIREGLTPELKDAAVASDVGVVEGIDNIGFQQPSLDIKGMSSQLLKGSVVTGTVGTMEAVDKIGSDPPCAVNGSIKSRDGVKDAEILTVENAGSQPFVNGVNDSAEGGRSIRPHLNSIITSDAISAPVSKKKKRRKRQKQKKNVSGGNSGLLNSKDSEVVKRDGTTPKLCVDASTAVGSSEIRGLAAETEKTKAGGDTAFVGVEDVGLKNMATVESAPIPIVSSDKLHTANVKRKRSIIVSSSDVSSRQIHKTGSSLNIAAKPNSDGGTHSESESKNRRGLTLSEEKVAVSGVGGLQPLNCSVTTPTNSEVVRLSPSRVTCQPLNCPIVTPTDSEVVKLSPSPLRGSDDTISETEKKKRRLVNPISVSSRLTEIKTCEAPPSVVSSTIGTVSALISEKEHVQSSEKVMNSCVEIMDDANLTPLDVRDLESSMPDNMQFRSEASDVSLTNSNERMDCVLSDTRTMIDLDSQPSLDEISSKINSRSNYTLRGMNGLCLSYLSTSDPDIKLDPDQRMQDNNSLPKRKCSLSSQGTPSPPTEPTGGALKGRITQGSIPTRTVLPIRATRTSSSLRVSSSACIAKPRTWHRTENLSSLHHEKQTFLGSSNEKLQKSFGKPQGTSYVRKGNSLVRKSSPVPTHSQGSRGFSTSVYRLDPLKKVDVKKSSVCERNVNNIKPPNVLCNVNGRPQTLPWPHTSKLPSCKSTKLNVEGALETTSNLFEVAETKVDAPKHAEGSEIQAVNRKMDTRGIHKEENLTSPKMKKLIYVKSKSNQLVAARHPEIHEPSVDVAEKNPKLPCSISHDQYFKTNKNQLIRNIPSVQGQLKHAVAIPDDNSNSEGQKTPKVASRKCSRNPSKQRSDRNLFPWKRMLYWRNNATSISNKSSSSLISKKLLLSRKRDTVYTRSTGGFSLRKSKVLSIGGSNLKWSKSIEKRSKKVNEEATLAVAAVEKKKREKREQKKAAYANAKKRNSSSRKSVHSIKLHSGERVFRIGSVRYRMDPSKRTLQRIPDDKATHAADIQSGKDTKKSFVPKRLLIGNDEYIRIGNGNQLVRDPKKRIRVLASEKIRWSLHTARLRLARKQQYCQFFTRFGKCNKEGGKCSYIHDPAKIAVCTKFLKGLCSNINCKLTHKVIPERMQDCSFFLRGLCTNENCPYRHVNVNQNAPICESFLRGFCADGNECNKKHSYVCPAFESTGVCSQGPKCKLHHPKSRNKNRKRKRSKDMKKATSGRYFGTRLIDDTRTVASDKCPEQKNEDILLDDGQLADYINLDVSDDEMQEINETGDTHSEMCSSDQSDDELINPGSFVNKKLRREENYSGALATGTMQSVSWLC